MKWLKRTAQEVVGFSPRSGGRSEPRASALGNATNEIALKVATDEPALGLGVLIRVVGRITLPSIVLTSWYQSNASDATFRACFGVRVTQG